MWFPKGDTYDADEGHETSPLVSKKSEELREEVSHIMREHGVEALDQDAMLPQLLGLKTALGFPSTLFASIIISTDEELIGLVQKLRQCAAISAAENGKEVNWDAVDYLFPDLDDMDADERIVALSTLRIQARMVFLMGAIQKAEKS